MTLDAVFAPRRVALVGASDQPGKVGTLLWENLSTFTGEVIPITSSATEVGGVRAYPTIGDVEGPIDLVVLAVPAAAVPEVARQAARAGVGGMVVLSGGFAETGPEGEALQAALAKAAGDVRVVGPNCFGIQNAALGLNASIAAGSGAEPGGISLITQSGAYGMAIHAMGRDEHVRFGKVYASGNKVDIDDHEVIDFLRSDPETRIVCVFAESVGDGAALAAAIRATTPDKPVIIAKTGRSEAGSRAARSHTGSLGTSDVVFRAAMRQSGAVLVRSGLEMLDTARALDGQPLPGGRRAAIITNSGGTGVELVDMLADEGVDVPELSAELQARIAERLPAFASPRNPVDMTPVWSRFAELYPWLIETLARSGEVDIVIPILLQRSAMDPSTVAAVGEAVARLRDDGVAVPVYVCWVAPRSARVNADLIQPAGVPCFEWPDRTARAVGHAVRYALGRRLPDPADPGQPAEAILTPGPMQPTVAAALLDDFGISTTPSTVCSDLDAALAATAAIDGPVVMKSADPNLAHRTEAGGVRLGIEGTAEAAEAYRHLSSLGSEVLVQPQIGGVEMAVGAVRDDTFGPLVMVGSGGTTLELFGDVRFALAPASLEEAEGLIAGLQGAALLTGYRGSDPADVGALARCVVGLARLMTSHPEIAEVDLNPVMVTPGGAVAVDWKVNVDERKV
ncbi:MAG: acetate--CoA ligase family protein [Acidimicrobiia bacterium]